MVKVFKYIGILCLFVFSFYYTDRVVNFTRTNDKLMREIESIENEYYVESVSAVIENDYIVPGENGLSVNLRKSYYNMKKVNSFVENLLIYDEIKPTSSIYDNYDKYLRKGNSNKNSVSFMFEIEDNNKIYEILSVLSEEEVKVTFFVSDEWVESNLELLYLIKYEGHDVAVRGITDVDELARTNNIIREIIGYNSMFCLSKEKNESILKTCGSNNMHTVIPTVVVYDDYLYNIKRKISVGSLILFDTSQVSYDYLRMTIRFVRSKGYEVKTVYEHLKE